MFSKFITSLSLVFLLLACGQNGNSFEGSKNSVTQNDSQDSTSENIVSSGGVETISQAQGSHISPAPSQVQPQQPQQPQPNPQPSVQIPLGLYVGKLSPSYLSTLVLNQLNSAQLNICQPPCLGSMCSYAARYQVGDGKNLTYVLTPNQQNSAQCSRNNCKLGVTLRTDNKLIASVKCGDMQSVNTGILSRQN